ncbi:MAG TPA: MOSC domain-containing protein [Thermaerobacter sp.]
MWTGRVAFICIAPSAAAPMTTVEQVRAVPGRGLEGDRYFQGTGTFWRPLPDYELTLIEIETLEALEREEGIRLHPADARRNIVTRGVPLNHLAGRQFRLGPVLVEGIRLCEPCGHLERLTRPGVREALVHRGGLRARILTEGIIRIGDVVAPVEAGTGPAQAVSAGQVLHEEPAVNDGRTVNDGRP